MRAWKPVYEKYKEQGLVVLGFPCITSVARAGQRRADRRVLLVELRRQFPMFSKIEVNGAAPATAL